MQTLTLYVVREEKRRWRDEKIVRFSAVLRPSLFQPFSCHLSRVMFNCRRWPFWVILFHFFFISMFLFSVLFLHAKTTLDCLLSAFFHNVHFKISSIKATAKQSQLKWKICKNCLALFFILWWCLCVCVRCHWLLKWLSTACKSVTTVANHRLFLHIWTWFQHYHHQV